MRIEILNTDQNHPINPYLTELKARLEYEDHSVAILRSAEELTHGELLFLISCSEKVNRSITQKFAHAMVIHASDLPLGRGWSPHIWEIITGVDQLIVSLIDASDSVDCGDIYKKIRVRIPKSSLWSDINHLLFEAEIQLIDFAIENFGKLKKHPQSLEPKPTYYRKRLPSDSEIDPEKSIAEQFDLIRVCDPVRFPAYFNHRGVRFKLILEKG